MEVKWIKDDHAKEHLMVRNCYKWYKVTAMFTDKLYCNEYLAVNAAINDGFPSELEGVIRVIGDCIFVAKNSDDGIEL